jgi:ketosteroid isomerase-like protein
MGTPEENKALVRRFYEEMDKGNLAAMDDLVAKDYVDHNPPPFPGLGSGLAGLKQSFEIFWKATPGYHRIGDQIAEGDKRIENGKLAEKWSDKDVLGFLQQLGVMPRPGQTNSQEE